MYRKRRVFFSGIIATSLALGVYFYSQSLPEPATLGVENSSTEIGVTSSAEDTSSEEVINILNSLPEKGRAPKTGYARSQFGNGWAKKEGCDTRNTILARDLTDIKMGDDCKVDSGVLNDPYTGTVIYFVRGSTTSSAVQIDHVVALSNAWQTGAQQISEEMRIALANDPLNLLAVDGPANQAKSDADAATWLPKYKPFRCQYITRQVQVKQRYELWVTPAEKQAMLNVLNKCN